MFALTGYIFRVDIILFSYLKDVVNKRDHFLESLSSFVALYGELCTYFDSLLFENLLFLINLKKLSCLLYHDWLRSQDCEGGNKG